jgi:glycosyltransferase involved in cell wall biosynthesis
MQKLLIIGYTWPEPKTTGAGVRMLQLIHFFIKNEFEITFVSAAEKSIYSEDLSALGITENYIQLNNSSFDDFVKNINPDVVVFDRFYTEEQFGWRVSEVCPMALRILDTEDLHFLRMARQTSLTSKNELQLLESDIAKRELASIFRSDISLIISEVEMEILKNEFKVDASLLHYLPFLINQNTSIKIEVPDYEERKHFIFIGNYKHQPNADAVLELKNKIWPLISKQLPEAELHCYGAYASQQIKELHNPKERFFISGWVEDIETALKSAKVMLAPIRFGAGLKRKFFEAMQFGTPSVTTKTGSEGITAGTLWNGFLEEDSLEFAKKAVQLYTDKKCWEESRDNGFELLNKRFMNATYESEFRKKLTSTLKNLKTHRVQNFTGMLLMHNTMQSSKYMSKWIEEKNKPKN